MWKSAWLYTWLRIGEEHVYRTGGPLVVTSTPRELLPPVDEQEDDLWFEACL